MRPLDPWRDGPAVANLLELAFRDEIGGDSGGQRMIHMLRHYSPLDALVGDDMRGFVWVEQGQIVGNVSLQRNPARRDTWVIGNVATHPAWRNRGISTALIRAAIAFARSRQGRFVALQVVEGNTPALRVYERAGFRALGTVTHYRRPSVRAQSLPLLPDAPAVRRARRADRDAVWTVARFNIPDHLTYAEPFDASAYRLDWRWWVSNFFNGWREQWLVRDAADHPADAGSQSIVGAIRTRVNFELPEHHVELMLDARASVEDGIELLVAGLRRLEDYVSKPLYCAQSRPHEATHGALQAVGFRPTRTLVHMGVKVEE
ncbi:MAG: GNAT family N-acetyltransferase [Anaerolineae bacterium]